MSTGVAARVALAAALLAAHVTASPSRDVLWERVGVFSDGRLSRLLSDVGAVCGRVDELLLSASPCGQADRDGASEATERQLRRLFGASYPYSVHCVDVTAPDVASILSQPASCLWARGRAAELDAWHTWLQDALPREWPVSVVVLIEDARGVHSPSDAGWQHSRSDEQFLSLIDSSAAGWYISCFGDVRSDGGVLRWCGDVLRDRGSVTRRQPPLAVHDTGGDGLASEGPASECPSTDAKLERLFDELHQQQFPASCEDRRLLVFRYSSLEYQGRAIQGFSVVFQHIASALTMARASNRTLVEVRTGADSDADLDPWNRAPLVPCGGAKFDCYFKQLAGCAFVPETLADLDALPRLDMERLLEQSDLIVVAPFDDDRIRQSVVHLSTDAAAPPWFRCESATARDATYRSPRLLWYRAFQLYLFKPLGRVVGAELEGTCAALHSSETATHAAPQERLSFALHVRHGDTAVSSSFYRRHTSVDTILVSLKAYVRWLHGGAAAHALAFLATDNVTLPESIHALARPELTVVSMPAYGMSNAVIEAANGTMLELFLGRLQPDLAHTAYDVTVSVIQDIYGMSCCTRIIGSCMSQVSRIAADLMYAKGLMRAPPVGFDCESCRLAPHWHLPLDWRCDFDFWSFGG